MEAMITSVLEFIRDASALGLRERLDLRTLVDDVVEDAVMIGNDVTVEASQAATVDRCDQRDRRDPRRQPRPARA